MVQNFEKLLAYTSEIIQYLLISVWLISLSIIPSSPIHVVANGSFILFYGWVTFHRLYMHIFFIHSSVVQKNTHRHRDQADEFQSGWWWWGGGWKKWKGIRGTNFQLQINKSLEYNVQHRTNSQQHPKNFAWWWLVDSLWWPYHKVYKCWIITLYTWN